MAVEPLLSTPRAGVSGDSSDEGEAGGALIETCGVLAGGAPQLGRAEMRSAASEIAESRRLRVSEAADSGVRCSWLRRLARPG